MIEFKADCGHTVRAKDEDSGKVVRCAYCGREAQVPADDQDELDFLFTDIGSESNASGAAPKTAHKPRRADRAGMPFGPSRSQADPFSVVKKMAYVAAVLICVIFVGKKYAWPMFQSAFLENDKPSATSSTSESAPRPQRVTEEPRKPKPGTRRMGFLIEDLQRRGNQGLYVNPVPQRATAYYCQPDPSAKKWEWVLDPATSRVETPGPVDLNPGAYVFVVVLPLNDTQLMRDYQRFGYLETRREIDERDRLGSRRADEKVADYFRPDEAKDVGVFSIRDRLHVGRRYEVTVYKNEWRVLTPQFIPRKCTLLEIRQFLPSQEAYAFNEVDIDLEFDYYTVAQQDRENILPILRRVGCISYQLPGDPRSPYMMFKIDPLDGAFSARTLSEAP